MYLAGFIRRDFDLRLSEHSGVVGTFRVPLEYAVQYYIIHIYLPICCTWSTKKSQRNTRRQWCSFLAFVISTLYYIPNK